jgi:integrase/recombinase XerD
VQLFAYPSGARAQILFLISQRGSLSVRRYFHCRFQIPIVFVICSVRLFRLEGNGLHCRKPREHPVEFPTLRLRTLFRFAQERKWVLDNPASKLKSPKVSLCPTMPYSRGEMVKILATIDQYSEEMPITGKDNARRIRALVLLLRYSGIRIGDAINLNTDRINGNRLFLYTQKTGVPVNAVLPDFVLKALEANPKANEKYFFWSGAGKIDGAVRSWQTRLRRLFQIAKNQGGHAHRFRDTFAVELLLAGVPIERVSILLGHQSVRITEKHYAPWVRSRQDQLEADLESAWKRDPMVLLETKGTPEVHGKRGPVN